MSRWFNSSSLSLSQLGSASWLEIWRGWEAKSGTSSTEMTKTGWMHIETAELMLTLRIQTWTRYIEMVSGI